MKRIFILFIVINNSYAMQQPVVAAASPRTDIAALIQKIQITILPGDIEALMRSMPNIEERLKKTGQSIYASSRNDVRIHFTLAGLKAHVYNSSQKQPVYSFILREFKEIISKVKAKTDHVD